jgi:hypothetical protein
MSIYLRKDEIKPGALVKAMSRDNEIIPALILDGHVDGQGSQIRCTRVIACDGETYIMNAAYLERWQ